MERLSLSSTLIGLQGVNGPGEKDYKCHKYGKSFSWSMYENGSVGTLALLIRQLN